jgi:hypothetical protein
MARGLCKRCYQKWLTGGDIRPEPPGTVHERDSSRRKYWDYHLAQSLGVHITTFLDWRKGKQVPRQSTLCRIMPKLELLSGIPAATWMQARDLSRALNPFYPPDSRTPRSKCARGHEMPLEGWGFEGTCRECLKMASTRYRERQSRIIRTACGKRNAFCAGLCSSCNRSLHVYGDPAVNVRVRNGESESGYLGVMKVRGSSTWYYRLMVSRRLYTRAGYRTAEDAARARDAKARELLGDEVPAWRLSHRIV